MQVKKHSGELVEFDLARLKGSLSKSGASTDVVVDVWQRMQPCIYDGITTRELYKLAFRLLKKEANSFAARYSLKKALRDLGPAGYFFEQWVARLFQHAHYQTITGQLFKGNSVTHEVDVVAQKDDEMLLVECKFRNTEEAKISVTTPMYFLSRVRDMDGRQFAFFDKKLSFTGGWLVTNAYLTKDAISFGEYHGVHMLAWDYPRDSSIKRRVDNTGLYPLTCLTTLTKNEKDLLLKRGCMLVKDILMNENALDILAISSQKKVKVLEEADELIRDAVTNG